MRDSNPFVWKGEVRDNETDLQGIVNNSNYFIYYAHCRHKFLKSLGINFADMSQKGFDFVLVHTDMSFKAPLLPNDEFIVTCFLESSTRVKFILKQEIIRISDQKVINTSLNTVTVIDRKIGRPKIPDEVKKALEF